MSTTTVEQLSFSAPVGGASLLLSFRLERKTIVIIGGGALAAARAFAALEADAKVVVLCAGGVEAACEELRWRATHKQLSVVDLSALPGSSADDLGVVLAKYLPTIGPISLLCVTDTMLGVSSGRRSRASAETISRLCRSRGIPANITDMPDLCDFSFTSTHRFADTTTGKPSSLQIGVTTNGQGCRIAARVRREIVAQLPKEVGTATGNISRLRERVKEAERSESLLSTDGPTEEENEDSGVLTPNRPVRQHHAGDIETAAERARRQMKWVAQVSEYWSFGQLARMSDNDMRGVLSGGTDGLLGDVLGIGADRSPHTRPALHSAGDSELASIHSLGLPAPPKSVKKGKIFLVGSGPGHPSLLTIATHAALTKHADLVLSDKLVPAAVLEIIPPHVEVRIARKFPGNAEGAQQEMMDAAVEAASRGLNVVRLKQGDPTVYGRAGEEVLHFRAHGFESVLIPGVSSALAAPAAAGIPVTQRGAADSFVVCTGVGRAGAEGRLPGYVRGRTLVVLMAVARLDGLISALLAEYTERGRRDGPAYPPNTPIAIIERGTMPDQRVIRSTLRDIVTAIESAGEQRPPGMIVIGWAVPSLWDKGEVTVLDSGAEERDEERISTWLDGKPWRVSEGLDAGWEGL